MRDIPSQPHVARDPAPAIIDAPPAAAFTPGPWAHRGRYVGTPNHMSFIAECRDRSGNWSDDTMSRANARLITAAPDLLEALENLLAFDGNGSGGLLDFQAEGSELGFQSDALTVAIERARAAIAKATAQ